MQVAVLQSESARVAQNLGLLSVGLLSGVLNPEPEPKAPWFPWPMHTRLLLRRLLELVLIPLPQSPPVLWLQCAPPGLSSKLSLPVMEWRLDGEQYEWVIRLPPGTAQVMILRYRNTVF